MRHVQNYYRIMHDAVSQVTASQRAQQAKLVKLAEKALTEAEESVMFYELDAIEFEYWETRRNGTFRRFLAAVAALGLTVQQ